MKFFYLLPVFLLLMSYSFAQFTRVDALPGTDILSFAINNDILYAASNENKIYKSSDGISWNSMSVSSNAIDISCIIFFNSKMYVGTFNFGVFFSSDNGNTWQNNGSGPSQISAFAIKDNVLYASTLGNGVAALNSTTGTWSFFNNSLPSYSVNVQCVTASAASLLIAAGANGTFYRYDFNANEWNEEYYYRSLRPGLQINRLLHIRDTLWAVNGNRVIKSSNGGLDWNDDKVGTHDGDSRFISAGTNNYYTVTNIFPQGTWIQERTRSAGIGTSWSLNEEFLPTGFSYDIMEFRNKLFLGRESGLYTKNLIHVSLPIRFESFIVKCEKGKAVLTWRTAGEPTGAHYDIEKSVDGFSYRVIGKLTVALGRPGEPSYSFTDSSTSQNSFYRIAVYDNDGTTQYTNIVRSSCYKAGSFTLWPNPTTDVIHLSITSEHGSKADIKLFDSKGALVKLQRVILIQGSNQVEVSLKLLAKGIYQLSAAWNESQIQQTVQVVKQ